MNTKPIPVRGSGSPRLPGSFPRVRGKHLLRAAADGVDGLIPARAGKTSSRQAAALKKRAHPRACGENEVAGLVHGGVPGSSPRVRGKRRSCHQAHRGRGLIPACAGKTSSASLPTCGRRAHPRVCGENAMPCHWVPFAKGSSPRVRGKQASAVLDRTWSRLIPACAGKTARIRRLEAARRAHPRVCGENGRRSATSG